MSHRGAQQTKCILVKKNVEDPNPYRHKHTHFRQWLMSFCCFCVVPHLLPRGLQHEPETIWSIWPITQWPVTLKYTYTHAHFWPHYAGGQPRFVPEHPLWHTHTTRWKHTHMPITQFASITPTGGARQPADNWPHHTPNHNISKKKKKNYQEIPAAVHARNNNLLDDNNIFKYKAMRKQNKNIKYIQIQPNVWSKDLSFLFEALKK